MKEKLKKMNEKDIIVFAVGIILGVLIMLLFYPDRIVELKDGEQVAVSVGEKNITADDLYYKLKEAYSINALVEVIDKTILENKYQLGEEDDKSIEEMADSYLSYYQSTYQMSEEDFLKNQGFETKKDFIEYLRLDYMRNKYYKDSLSDDEVKDYYEKEVFGPVKVEHILVKISSDLSDANAKTKAQEILDKIKNGTSWEDAKNQYKDSIVNENFTVQFDSSLEESFFNAVKGMQDNTISSGLVKTSYGYHIINRISSEEKPTLESINNQVRTAMVSVKQKEDKNYYQKTLIKMREEAKTEIKDTELKKVYQKYTKMYE